MYRGRINRSIFIKSYRIVCLACILMITGANTIRAQQETDYAVRANIIYRFTKYIDWPEDKKSGDFVIGFVGESPLYDYLKKFIANKTVGNQKIIIKTFSTSLQVFDCHILIICENERFFIKKIATATANFPMLIVTAEEGLAQKGSCINFIIEDDRLKLEINKKNILQRHLNIATELLELGTIVK